MCQVEKAHFKFSSLYDGGDDDDDNCDGDDDDPAGTMMIRLPADWGSCKSSRKSAGVARCSSDEAGDNSQLCMSAGGAICPSDQMPIAKKRRVEMLASMPPGLQFPMLRCHTSAVSLEPGAARYNMSASVHPTCNLRSSTPNLQAREPCMKHSGGRNATGKKSTAGSSAMRKKNNKKKHGMLSMLSSKMLSLSSSSSSSSVFPRAHKCQQDGFLPNDHLPVKQHSSGVLYRLEEQVRMQQSRPLSSVVNDDFNHCGKIFGCDREEHGQGTFPSQARSVLYALEDNLVFGSVKNRQSASCFPRQSAHDACRAILAAIGKFATRDREVALSKNSNAVAADPGADLCGVLLLHSAKFEHPMCSSGSSKLGGAALEGTMPDESIQMNLDHILSNIPYREMIVDMLQHTANPGPAHAGVSSSGAQRSLWRGARSLDVPLVTKTYEESFMREPMWDYERLCVMGSSCECNFISTRAGEAFTAVEFLPPSAGCSDEKQTERQMCVLCHRKFVQGVFYDIVYSGVQCKGVIQRYGNICNVAGEYAREVMLIIPPSGPVECMPLALVSHQRNKYSVFSKNGIRYVRQHRVAWEDFWQAPPLSAVP